MASALEQDVPFALADDGIVPRRAPVPEAYIDWPIDELMIGSRFGPSGLREEAGVGWIAWDEMARGLNGSGELRPGPREAG